MDIHVLDQADDRKTVNLIFHIPLPVENNVVGISLQTAVVGYLGGADAITSKVGDAGELTAMKAGTIFEMPVNFRFSSTEAELDDNAKLAEISAYYNQMVTEIQALTRNRLAYWGFQTDVS